MAQAEDQQLFHAKRKAISSLFPYVLWQDQVGQQELLDALSHAAMAPRSAQFIWRCVKSYITQLSKKPSPRSSNQVFVLASPYVSWCNGLYDENMVTRWAAAAAKIPYTEEVGQSVVDALLHIASVDSLRPHIPVGIWAWLKRRPSLPPECSGRSKGSERDVVCHIRALGDIEVLESYLVLVWSEWDPILSDGFVEICTSIREDFGGIGMEHYREDLIKRLDHVLGEFTSNAGIVSAMFPRFKIHNFSCMSLRAKEQCRKLKNVLLEVDREAMNVLARTPPSLIPFTRSTDTNTHRIPLDFHVRSASPMPVVCLERLPLLQPTTWFVHWFLSRCCFSLHSTRRLRMFQTCLYVSYPGRLVGPVGEPVAASWISRCP